MSSLIEASPFVPEELAILDGPNPGAIEAATIHQALLNLEIFDPYKSLVIRRDDMEMWRDMIIRIKTNENISQSCKSRHSS
jgi:hypothetical protein